MMMKYNKSVMRKAALSLAVLMFLQACYPTLTWALTSGPTQPEVQSFEAVGSTQMVDLFSGDFTYNIPLLEVPGANGGYPINLFYNSVTNAEEEATMVGLGWNIGIGALTNQVRGLPDAFDGDRVKRKMNVKDNWTIGLGYQPNLELFGADPNASNTPPPMASSSNTQFTPTLGIKLMYNNYRGFGYSIDPGMSISMGAKDPKTNKFALTSNFGISLNSLEGASVNASLSLADVERDAKTNYTTGTVGGTLGIGLSGREGLKNISLSGYQTKNDPSNGKSIFGEGANTGSNNYSFSNSTYTPKVDMPFGGTNISLSAKLGADIFGAFANSTVSGFYSEQWLKNQNKWVDAPAYGYMNAQNASGKKALMDFNREKDGAIYHEQPNLAIPIATPDILSVTGHGVGGAYRAYRSDWGGVFVDPQMKSNSAGGAFGIEFGTVGASTHFGTDYNINFSKSESKKPFTSINGFQFQGHTPGNDFEPYYYKASGEMTGELDADLLYNNIGGDLPIKVGRDGLDFEENYQRDNGVLVNTSQTKREDGERKPRTSSIQPLTNGEILNSNGEELLPEYQVQYYDHKTLAPILSYPASTQLELTRDAANENHLAAYTVVNDGGARWNYALPVQNNVQYQATFAVAQNQNGLCQSTIDIPRNGTSKIDDIDHEDAKTDDFLDIQETPGYAHSHLLTSILGSDFIDVDDNGPSDEDLGYWMKVEYVKTSDNYIWKSPFCGANFLEGHKMTEKDDKGTFMAGARQQYYPARIETNTHVAEFYYSIREDGRGAGNFLYNEGDAMGAYSFKVDQIKLFSKIELEQNSTAPTPIKTIHFEYSYDLCKGVFNNAGGSGKLTLEKVWFTYENSNRGSLSPYRFEYPSENPGYDAYDFDRWGSYRASDACENIHNPFVKQFEPVSGGEPLSSEGELNTNIAAWHLSDIYLPSGSHIHLDLERDHYSHVQDRVATQMFNIARAGGTSDTQTFSNSSDPNQDQRRIYFNLETPIPFVGDDNDPGVIEQLEPYFDDLYAHNNGVRQLFYKVNANLLKAEGNDVNNQLYYEDVTGYVDIADFGFNESCRQTLLDDDGNPYTIYNQAFIELAPFPIEVRNKNYHPIVMGNWQYLKVNLSEKMFGYDLGNEGGTSIGARLGQFAGLLGELVASFRNYYKVCRDRDYGVKFNADKSFIRLNSPDRKKFGGGVRVKQVTMSDNYWAEFEATPAYGMVYDYDMEEELYDPASERMVKTGRMISSGIAANEPSVGTEECALRYAKNFVDDVKNRTDNMFTFEYPVNESYYPGPSIGYSKVTVKSLASEYAMLIAAGEDLPDYAPELPTEFATSGVTINEFYTAKDFPIVTEETIIDDGRNPAPRWIPIPLIGDIRVDKYTATQGYKIELNDMHGRPKTVTNFAQDKTGNIIPEPISSISYFYKERPTEIYTLGNKSRLRHRLHNTVTVLQSENLVDVFDSTEGIVNNTERSEAEMGVEREFFTDARETKSISTNGGLDFNSELFIVLFPLLFPLPWPTVGYSENHLKTAVTNKIVRRSGILERVVATDGQSAIETKNIAFDQYTGQALLTTVNNNFNNKVYNYTVPGYFSYDQMGPAYENWGYKFNAEVSSIDPATGIHRIEIYDLTGPQVADKLVPGDEFIIGDVDNGTLDTRATYLKSSADGVNLFFAVDEALTPGNELRFNLIRSGNRNHLTAAVGGITTLGKNPTVNRTTTTCDGCFGSIDSKAEGPESNRSSNPSNFEYHKIDSVLQASAATYSDVWITDLDKECRGFYPHYTDGSNPYKIGQLGIWRPHRSFAYVTDRSQTSGMDLSKDGVFRLDAFNWENPLLPDCTPWRMVEETSKYGPNGEALESKNILDIYSSALYGYNGYLPTATATNSRYYEIAYEGFEEMNLPTPTVDITTHTFNETETGHFDFLNVCSYYHQVTSGEVSRILSSFTSGTSDLTIDRPFDGQIPSRAWFNLFSSFGEKYTIEAKVISLTGTTGEETSLLTIDPASITDCIPSGLCLAGDVVFEFERKGSEEATYGEAYLIKGGYAHTGNQSLFLPDPATWVMSTINLESGKDYIFSGWIRVLNLEPLPTYDDGYNKITVHGQEMKPAGPVIDGWQRIEGTFNLSNPEPSIDLEISLGSQPAYFDDFRIFPADGNMTSYVYDKANYRVTEILDENNYFTRYIYDSEGNLISTQKETVDGVKTLQEAGTYVREID